MPSYMGKAPLSLVRTLHGSVEYVYAGHPAPEGIVPEDLDRLVDEGFLVEVPQSPEEAKAPAKKAAAAKKAPAATKTPAGAAETGPAGDVKPPALAAKRDLWVDFRVSQGIPREAMADEAAVSKEQLQDDDFVATLRPQA